MIPTTSPAIWAALKDRANNDIWDVCDSGIPTNGTSGTGVNLCGPGSKYVNLSNGDIYYNIGTKASPFWTTGVQVATGTISAADIVATGAGKFGHAQGYPLVAAPGANKALILHFAVASYKFATAAFTGGGNTTVNWSGGGAALTGLVAAASFAAAASDKPVLFVPLSTAGIALVANAGLNLVSSVAFTQPGTAAGVIYFKVFYATVNLDQ